MAERVVVSDWRGDEDKVGHQASGDHAPHQAANQVSVARLDQSQSPDWVTDAKVSMHADASEEEDAAVEVGVEKEAYDFTGGHTEGPVAAVGVVVDEGG